MGFAVLLRQMSENSSLRHYRHCVIIRHSLFSKKTFLKQTKKSIFRISLKTDFHIVSPISNDAMTIMTQ